MAAGAMLVHAEEERPNAMLADRDIVPGLLAESEERSGPRRIIGASPVALRG